MVHNIIATGANLSLTKKILQLKQNMYVADHSPTITTAKTGNKEKEVPPNKACRSMEEEDTLFMNAMGVFSKQTNNHDLYSVLTNAVPLREKRQKNLTGASLRKPVTHLKDLKSTEVTSTSTETINTSIITQEILKKDVFESIKNISQSINIDELPNPIQTKIHLAAGISVTVSSRLDLSGHTKTDATERLKECIINGYVLGWHNMHVLTGNSEELGKVVINLLKSPTGKHITRYAQAPIPMGGPNAWILYF